MSKGRRPRYLSAKTAICVLERNGELVWQGKVDSDPGSLIEEDFDRGRGVDLVGLEACPLSEWLHRELVAAGFEAVCIETPTMPSASCRQGRSRPIATTPAGSRR